MPSRRSGRSRPPCIDWSRRPADGGGRPPLPSRLRARGSRGRRRRGSRRGAGGRPLPGAAPGPPQARVRSRLRLPDHRRDLRAVPEDRGRRRGARQLRRGGVVLDPHRDRVQRGGLRGLRRPVPRSTRRHSRRRRSPPARPARVVPDHDGRAGGHADLLRGGRRRHRAHLLGTSQGGDAAPPAGTVVPAAVSGGIIVLFLMIAAIPDDFERRIDHYARGYRRARFLRRIATGPATLAMGTRTAIAYIRHPRRGLLAVGGAAGFWAANIGILWASFEAFGGHVPFAVLVQGFFVGMAANLTPSPAGGVGAVDAGMIGAFSIFGIDNSVVFPAVLTYRVIAFWLPIPPGIVAFVQLRKTVTVWERESPEPDATETTTLQKVKY